MYVACTNWVDKEAGYVVACRRERDRVSGPSDSGSRSTSGDTGEGELRTGPAISVSNRDGLN